MDQARRTNRELVGVALEACRLEVLRRLNGRRLPSQVTMNRSAVVQDESGSRSEVRRVRASSLNDLDILLSVRDDTVPHSILGLRDELLSLAQHLEATTDLGSRPSSYLPALTGVDAILARYLTGLAFTYMSRLRDLGRGDLRLIDRLAAELDLLCDGGSRAYQLAVAGIRPRGQFTYKNASVRRLSPFEQGLALDLPNLEWQAARGIVDFVPPRRFDNFWPTAVIETRGRAPQPDEPQESTLPIRLALAFILSGYELSAAGSLASFAVPRWASHGIHHSPFPVYERPGAVDIPLTQRRFEEVVDLALRTPEFTGMEGNAREVALYRVLRGSGMHWRESGFLDFAIALEAALLPRDAKTELGYRFSLYGALFLRHERDPIATFADLRTIYRLRSNLVHGSRVSPTDLRNAAERAGDIARAVMRRAINHGWPEQKELDRLAVTLENRKAFSSSTPAESAPRARR
jgi:hypothetical protein